jgi:ferrous iron transport protein B
MNQNDNIKSKIQEIRKSIDFDIHEAITSEIYRNAGEIAGAVADTKSSRMIKWQESLDRLLTGKLTGLPIMFLMLVVVFWLTIAGANVPSGLLASFLVDYLHPLLKDALSFLPWWLNGILVDGMYLATAWVVSVMLPPMAIFFPLFTLLEDFGYLPRVAFNLDHLFRKAGAHGKQALTMTMGFGCNAAGVISTRIIDSPRERLIAIITNNFSLCNGRWPTQILLASVFIGALASPALSGIISAGAVVGVTVLGVIFSFLVSWLLSKTMLKGKASSFTLELPPFRKPNFWRTIYTSLIDRTIFVLWRAVVFALPAGALIWLVANVTIGGEPIAVSIVGSLDPFAIFFGLNGIILLAYIIAIPANEIVIPTILMLTVLLGGNADTGSAVMFEFDDLQSYKALFAQGGWTLLTAINLMLFSLLHNPCSTTIYTIYKETKSAKWTVVASILPVILGFAVTGLLAFIWRLF